MQQLCPKLSLKKAKDNSFCSVPWGLPGCRIPAMTHMQSTGSWFVSQKSQECESHMTRGRNRHLCSSRPSLLVRAQGTEAVWTKGENCTKSDRLCSTHRTYQLHTQLSKEVRLQGKVEKDEGSSSTHTFPFAGTDSSLVVTHTKNAPIWYESWLLFRKLSLLTGRPERHISFHIC